MLMVYLFGLIFVMLPLISFINSWQIKKNKIEVDAIVVRTDRIWKEEGYSFFPVLKYEISGEQFEKRYTTGSIKPTYSDGEIVTIFCHKKNYKRILLPNDKTAQFINILFLTLGLLAITIATIVG